ETLPWEALKSPVSRSNYRRKSRWLLEYGGYVDPRLIHHKPGPGFAIREENEEIERGMRRFIDDARSEPEKVRTLVLGFITDMNTRIDAGEISHDSVKSMLKPFRLALDLNDIPFSWKNPLRLIHVHGTVKDREYTLDEIRLMAAKAALPIRVAILFMASSGIRIGAFDFLRVRDVAPLEIDGRVVCGRLTVYAGEGHDEYETLISREAYDTWTEYIKIRGNPPPDAPAIASRSGRAGVKSATLKNVLNKIAWRTGLRKEKKKRHEVQIAHGFRKFYDNVAKDYMDEPYVEKLMGHDTGTKEHYDRHLPKPAIEQYLRAMPFLSISEAYRQVTVLEKQLEAAEGQNRQEMTELRLQVLESEKKQRELEKDREQLRLTTIEMESLKKRLAALGDLEKRQEETEKIISELSRIVEGKTERA
ncbi:MAG: hypothetical protein JRM98_04970, partial [Nitrososphaerota archaeon]|nr:hypothetical protein [Nitrososphaerota archaeon]